MDALALAVMFTVPHVEHVAISDPASAVGAGLKVIVFVEVALAQPELAAVNVTKTLPAVMSAALGA